MRNAGCRICSFAPAGEAAPPAAKDRNGTRFVAETREIPIPAVQRILLSVVEGHRRIEAVLGQVAPTEQGIGAPTPAARMLGEVGVSGSLSPLVVLAQDEVDDAADRIAAVDGGRAVLQHLDALDGCDRAVIDVDGGAVGEGSARAHAPAVDQHQGPLGAQAPQRNAGDATGGCTGCGCHHAVAVALQRHSEPLQELLDVGRAGGLDLLSGDDLHRKCGLGVDASDARAGDLDAFDGLLRESGRRDQRGHPCGADRNRLCRRDAADASVLHVSSPFIKKTGKPTSPKPLNYAQLKTLWQKNYTEGAANRPGPGACRGAAWRAHPGFRPVRAAVLPGRAAPPFQFLTMDRRRRMLLGAPRSSSNGRPSAGSGAREPPSRTAWKNQSSCRAYFIKG